LAIPPGFTSPFHRIITQIPPQEFLNVILHKIHGLSCAGNSTHYGLEKSADRVYVFHVRRTRTMRTTVTIDKEILDELVRESGLKNKASAVREAVALYLRQKRIAKIRQMKSKVRFDKTAEEIRHYER
jgi:Arc/MetJ family transcription regulator